MLADKKHGLGRIKKLIGNLRRVIFPTAEDVIYFL
jgi:hypothetical protein